MKWLIWKEYRLNRSILIFGVLALIAPYAVFAVVFLHDFGPDVSVREFVGTVLKNAVLLSMVLSQFTLCSLGGNAIACERTDRSAEFLAYLPISRPRILAGKITLSLLCLVLIWVPNLLVLAAVQMLEPLHLGWSGYPWSMLVIIASTGSLLFSGAWLLSSVLESPTFAICGGLITPLFFVAGGLLLESAGFEHRPGLWYPVACLTVALAYFIAGTWYYLRRVEP